MNLDIAIVLPHFEINGEKQDLRWKKIEREIFICKLLNDHNNVNAKFFLPQKGKQSPPHWIELDHSKIYLYKVNKDNKNQSDFAISNDLLNELKIFNPRIIITKPLGYRFHLWLISSFRKSEVILISGGLRRDNGILKYSQLFLAESNKQINLLLKNNNKSKVLMKNANIELDIKKNIKNKYDFICIGRLNKNKNLESILELGKLFKGIIIGNGPEYLNLERIIKKNKLNILMKGELDRKQTLTHLRESSILLHPSLSEGVPRVFAEAKVLGVPIIAFENSNLASKDEFPNLNELKRNSNITKEFTKILGLIKKDKFSNKNKENSLNSFQIYQEEYSKNLDDIVNSIIKVKRSSSLRLTLRFVEVYLRYSINRIKSILKKK